MRIKMYFSMARRGRLFLLVSTDPVLGLVQSNFLLCVPVARTLRAREELDTPADRDRGAVPLPARDVPGRGRGARRGVRRVRGALSSGMRGSPSCSTPNKLQQLN